MNNKNAKTEIQVTEEEKPGNSLECKISLFENAKSTKATEFLTIKEFLSNVEKSVYSNVNNAREYYKFDAENNTSMYKDYKQKSIQAVSLSSYCLSRNKNTHKLIYHTGVLQIDIDGLTEVKQFSTIRNKLKKDKKTLFMFTSLSGTGLKVGIKIDSKYHLSKEWNEYYLQIVSYYDKLGIKIDKSCKDVYRLCFVSLDSEVFINSKSSEFVFTDINNTEEKHTQTTAVNSLNNNTVNIDSVKSKHAEHGIRNANNIILRSVKGEFHNSRLRAGRLLGGYVAGGFFTEEEALDCIKDSVYLKCADNWKTQALKDVIKGLKYGLKDAIRIENLVKSKYFTLKKISKNETGEIIESSGNSVEILNIETGEINVIDYVFWDERENKTGGLISLKINSNNLYSFIRSLGVKTLKLDDTGMERLLLRIENNIVTQIDLATVQNLVMNYIKKLPVQISNNKTKYDLEEIFRNGLNVYISMEKLTADVEWEKIEFLQDSGKNSYFFFKNGFVDISSSNIQLKDYSELHGYIWRSQVINHNFSVIHAADVINNFDFAKFTRNICSVQKEGINQVDEERYLSLKQTLGYLLHNYKTTANKKAVILTESNIDLENSKGGTGKGLLMQAVSKLRNTSTIDGKNFNFDNTFCFQNVNLDTQIIFFDDVKSYFNFERLFSTITEGLSFERKNQQRINLPPEKSPKIVISTNYSIIENSGSANRRKYEMELLCYYSEKNTPVNEFGREFFHTWNEAEWIIFYNFMFTCLQSYFQNNCIISKYNSETNEEKKLINATNLTLVEFAGHLERNEFINSNECYFNYLEFSGSSVKDVTQTKFSKWISKYCEFKNLNFKSEVKRHNGKSTRFYFIGNYVNEKSIVQTTFKEFDNLIN